MKTLICSLLILLSFNTSAEKCEHDVDSIMMHEQRILATLKEGGKIREGTAAKPVFESLTCLLEIEQQAKGWTKYLAHSFLQPFYGAGQIAGVPLDHRYAQVSELLNKMAEFSKDPAHMSLLEAHAKGEWGLYGLMCEQGSTAYCTEFLPEADKIASMPSLVAASSMLVLKMAYQRLDVEQQQKIAARIRELYRVIDKKDVVKRRVIDEIYKEIFLEQIPVSLLS